LIFPALGFGGSNIFFKISIKKVLRNGFFQLLASSWFWRQRFSFQNKSKSIEKLISPALGKILVLAAVFFL